MTISATLTQTKKHVPEWPEKRRIARFAVRSQVTAATIAKLGTPFVMKPLVPGMDKEVFLRVATPADLSGPAMLPINPLIFFRNLTGPTYDSFDVSAYAQLGYKLFITSPPEVRPEGEAIVPDVITQIDSGGHRVKMTNPSWYNNTVQMGWELRDADGNALSPTPITGSYGYYERQAVMTTPWRDDRYMFFSEEAQYCLDHMTAVQATLKSLIDTLALTPEEYYNYTPGNPVVNSYTG